MEPSAVSLSPHSTHTWNGRRSRYWPASAIPTPTGRPWPSDPVATSTQGSAGVGCPCRREPNCRYVSTNSWSVIAPTALKTEYSSGEAWPLEKTRWSLPRWQASAQS
ncbi:hypothetical protein JD77_05509 [Micromonospora olivasterospora]|uniref:Uncharacterized protein n=1 Tax=Micromonospora olivasterospora TaxID=1880 RepID=A0A562IIN1_MICOL|nr:hypothetical protein JD77_05509 [Micromonospora olivasterospora]